MNFLEDKRENGIIYGIVFLFCLMEGGFIYDFYIYEYVGVNLEIGVV